MLKKIVLFLSLSSLLLSVGYSYPDVQLLTCFRTSDENNIDINFERLNVGAYDLVDGDITIDTDNGNGVNTLDTGTLEINTWYAIHVIYNPSDGSKAGLISLSRTAPVLPPGYTVFRTIGWCHTDSETTTIRKFHYNGGGWWLYDSCYNVVNNGVSTTATPIDCSFYAPPTSTLFSLFTLVYRGSANNHVVLGAPGESTFAVSGIDVTGATAVTGRGNFICPSDSSQSIYYYILSSANNGKVLIYINGYLDNITPL